ncbi:MAG TPA: ADP-forming succinate--CoA ligase subunit beta [Verrucomicrobiales bacterium]|nr:ADP-forming succinate--CoA ligase subunit beta [Verrucomicrobiales bacterium]HIL68658.1 ADP-forming succinate--CoA ligase subunit beta [Verrucomicrobiota bacterium]
MNIHECQAKELLAAQGVPVPTGNVCQSIKEVEQVVTGLFSSGVKKIVIKSQIHAGGRGKGTFKNDFQGGVKLTDNLEEALDFSGKMLNEILVTKQTGPEGRKVRKLLISEASEIETELYLAVLLDRELSLPIVMASTEGGVDIEEVAEQTPEKIVRQEVDPSTGLLPFQARGMAIKLGFEGKLINAAAGVFLGVYNTFWNYNASMVEINPLCIIRTPDGKQAISAVDAKISIDDNALPRHPEIQKMRDLGEEEPQETEAAKYDLSYIKLDGNIACLVNGAGLAMATMDIIKHYGGNPANFLDVGGGAGKEQVAAAFRIILEDENVQGILVNIFGGIMQCDIIAQGILAAVEESHLELPLVVRLEGSNVALGKKIIADSGLAVIGADSLAEAAQKVVKAVA